MTIRVKDNGAEALLDRIGARLSVRVGVIGAKANAPKEGGTQGVLTGNTVAEVASMHEFGLGVPERSFIRGYVDENVTEIKKWERTAGRNILNGKWDPIQAMNLLGLQIVAGIQERITNRIPPPNADSTIERKGSSTPLVGITSQLKSSIIHEVEDHG